MSNQLTREKAPSTVGFNAAYLATLFLVTFMLGMFGSAAILSFFADYTFAMIFSSFMFFYCLWSFGGHYVSIPMTMYLNAKYRERQYHQLDAAHRRALKILSKLPFKSTVDVPVLTSNLALVRLCQGQYDSAEELFQEAVTFICRERMLRESFSTAILINNLGCAMLRRGRLAEAEVHANRALEILALPRNKSYKLITALPHSLIGAVHAKLDEYDTALEHFQTALSIYNSEKPPVGTITTSFTQGKTQAYLWSALCYAKLGRLPESEMACDTAFGFIENDSGAVNTLTIEVLQLLASEYLRANLYSRAERVLGIAYGQCVESPNHPDARLVVDTFEKLLVLTDRQSETPDMKAWLHPVQTQRLLITASSN